MGEFEDRGDGEQPDEPDGDIVWQPILEGRAPRIILSKLLDGDPLRIVPACTARMLERAILLDPDRLYLRAVARIALAGFKYRGSPPFGRWRAQCIDQAMIDLVAEDVEAERRGEPIQESSGDQYRRVAENLGIEPGLARRVCVEINKMEDDMRHAFFAVHVLGRSINTYVAEGHGQPAKVRELVEAALRRLRRIMGDGGKA